MDMCAKLCKMCGRPVVGRSDKIFCCEACRNRWHYHFGEGHERYSRKVLSALRKNYEIMESLLSEGRTSVDLLRMQDLGFKPAYITGHRRARYGHDEYRCVEISYCMTQRKVFRIFREEPAV